jgi:hypothetical protein
MDGNADQNNHPKKTNNTPAHLMSGNADPSPIPATPSHNNTNGTNQKPDWQRRHYRVQVAAVIVGIVVAYIYGCQLNEMMKSTRAATDAAKAAKDSVAFARENARLDQRAWVGVIRVEGGAPQVDQIWKTNVSIKNDGRTPAKQLKVVMLRKTVEAGKSPDFTEEDRVSKEIHELLLLPPTEGFVISGDSKDLKKVGKESLESINSGKYIVFLFGTVTYNDVFNCSHWTKFCYKLDAASGEFSLCENHNDADDNQCR